MKLDKKNKSHNSMLDLLVFPNNCCPPSVRNMPLHPIHIDFDYEICFHQ